MPETEPPTDETSQMATQVTCQDGNDERGTPTKFIRKLQQALPDDNMFALDPCSGAEPTAIAKNRFTKEDNGLAQAWDFSTVYVNPPYSDLKQWLKKIVFEAERDDPEAPDLILSLLPANTSTKGFQNYASKCDYLCLIEGRLTFHGTDTSAPFASLLTVFGEDIPERTLSKIADLGTLYSREEIREATEQARLDDMFGIAPDGGVATMQTSSESSGPGLSHGGTTVRDVSRAAPAVPQGVIDFYDLSIHDELYLELETSIFGGQRSDIPSGATVGVLSGESIHAGVDDEKSDWHNVLCVDPETETYFVLLQDPNDLTNIHCLVENKEHIPLKTVQRISFSGTVGALDPYGKGTSYVA